MGAFNQVSVLGVPTQTRGKRKGTDMKNPNDVAMSLIRDKLPEKPLSVKEIRRYVEREGTATRDCGTVITLMRATGLLVDAPGGLLRKGGA